MMSCASHGCIKPTMPVFCFPASCARRAYRSPGVSLPLRLVRQPYGICCHPALACRALTRRGRVYMKRPMGRPFGIHAHSCQLMHLGNYCHNTPLSPYKLPGALWGCSGDAATDARPHIRACAVGPHALLLTVGAWPWPPQEETGRKRHRYSYTSNVQVPCCYVGTCDELHPHVPAAAIVNRRHACPAWWSVRRRAHGTLGGKV